jgi:leucine zipper transcription factor-like protein 1
MASSPSSISTLSPQYREFLEKYLAHARTRRDQHLREVELAFTEVRSSRLTEDTYTREELRSILDSLSTLLRSSVTKEIQSMTHANAEVLRSVFKEIDALNIHVHLDMRTFEDASAHASIAQLDRPALPPMGGSKLAPLGGGLGGSDPLALKEENLVLKDKLAKMQTQYTQFMREKTGLSEELEATKEQVRQLQQQVESQEVASSQSRHAQAEAAASASANAAASHAKEQVSAEMQKELDQWKSKCRELEDKVKKVQEDVDKKVMETPQFQNMRKMLESKNSELKRLREELAAKGGDAE